MSNYYHRDNEGNWFVKHGKKLTPVEFSASMEIAFTMGKIAELDQLRERANENLMLVRDARVWGVDNSSIQS
jgi:hypothetical protein